LSLLIVLGVLGLWYTLSGDIHLDPYTPVYLLLAPPAPIGGGLGYASGITVESRGPQMAAKERILYRFQLLGATSRFTAPAKKDQFPYLLI
jgi:hypothetical protein